MTASYDLRFDSGRLCLDLVATVGSRLSPHPVERLDGPARLAEWLRRAGVVPEDEPLDPGPGDLDRFIALRGLLHRIIRAEVAGETAGPGDTGRLNEAAAAGAPASRLELAADGTPYRRLALPPRTEQLLAAVAEDAIRLLASPERGFLRECEGPTCDLVYLDLSRGRRRRWCSAGACGNRHYVASHRARKAGEAGEAGGT